MSNLVVIRADASVHIGSGHVMRCLTLANALADSGARILFICRELDGHLCAHIEASPHALLRLAPPSSACSGTLSHAHWLGVTQAQDAEQTAALLLDVGPVDCLIVDHYGLDIEWESALRERIGRLLVIDDLANRQHDADILLDQNYCLHLEERYQQWLPSTCRTLLGPKFALLRPEFQEARKRRQRDGKVRGIFIFFGGSDLGDETGKAVRAVLALGRNDIVIDVVVGAAYAHLEELAGLCAGSPSVRLHRQVQNIAELMAHADLALGAGGGTMWERCCLGLPTLVMSIAENQQTGCEAVAAAGAILYLGVAGQVNGALLQAALQIALSSPWLLASMGTAAAALLDGQGARRVAQRLMARQLTLRPAGPGDCERIFQWRNTDQTRQFSGSSAPIALDEHVAWFAKTLADPERQILIGESDGKAVGVVRFDRKPRSAVISIFMAPGYAGRGMGVQLIEQGSAWIACHWPTLTSIEAVILAANGPSISAFSETGFQKKTSTYVKQIGN